MAYFANGSEGMVFDCEGCKYQLEPCPIALVQMEFNYDACNNETATKILNCLVKDDGTCMMQQMMDKHINDQKIREHIDSVLPDENLYQCPYVKACKCDLKEPCLYCETFGEYLNEK